MPRMTRARAQETLKRLQDIYPTAHCALNYRSPWELLIATILSAQCTDERVNKVTAVLFERFPGPREMLEGGEDEVAEIIRSVGCYRTKARSLVGTAHKVLTLHHGEVPQSLEALVNLPGVGRKTANVVRGNAFDFPGMVVDTHVKRISFRLGWTRQTDPDRIEKDLCRLLPDRVWTQAGHTLIAHGRALCKAPTPICSQCPLLDECPRNGVSRSK